MFFVLCPLSSISKVHNTNNNEKSDRVPFIDDILRYRSVAIVGLAKNTGKTVCLNYILRRLSTMDTPVAITSIGVDGEHTDRVTSTPKPQVTIYKGMTFVTSEVHYLQRQLVSEIVDVGRKYTSLGRLITANVIQQGKCLISGPAETMGVKALIDQLSARGIQTTLVDGALSRMSLASPAVTDGIVLATGAAFSANIPQLVRKTKYVKQLIELPRVRKEWLPTLSALSSGIWAVDDEGSIHDLEIPSIFLIEKREKDIFRYGTRLFVTGAISDKLLNFLRQQRRQVELIVSDFTKVFATQEVYDAFVREGNRMLSLMHSNLIAVTVNPYSPAGFYLDSETLREQMSRELNVPVYDIMKITSP